MDTLASQLSRLGRGQARALAGAWARRQHLRLLLLAVLLAACSRLLVPLPGLAAVERRLVPVALLVAGLWLALLVLRALARPWLTPAPERLARRLDDERGWKDAAATALDVERGRAHGALGRVLAAEVGARLAAEPMLVPQGAPRGRPWLRIALSGLFAALLLLPGVLGLGGTGGAGRGGEIGAGWREDETTPGQGPMDADRWMREHARLLLEPVELADATPRGRLRVLLRSGLPLPAAYRGELALLWDERVIVPLGEIVAPAGEPLAFEHELDVRALPALAEHLTPGVHKARARLAPLDPPFTQALRSNLVEVTLEPPEQGGGGGGGGAAEPPTPPPTPPPEPPAAAPDEGPKATPPPPSGLREEAVTPFVNEGETVKKEQAVVAVKDPEAGLAPPPAQPLPEALRAFDKVVESAVGRERIAPADQALVRRYFETLRRLTEPQPR